MSGHTKRGSHIFSTHDSDSRMSGLREVFIQQQSEDPLAAMRECYDPQ